MKTIWYQANSPTYGPTMEGLISIGLIYLLIYGTENKVDLYMIDGYINDKE